MITFQKIKWKNFLSTGDHWSEIDFTGHTTNLVVGTNGSGKSTMLDALTFALFNKPFRKINKSQLVNATNEKDCCVEVEFSVNNKDYLVRRSIKPNKFDIEVNGTLLHKEADDRANQKILKVIVRKKSDPKQFEKYIDNLYSSILAELKIVENFDFTEGEEFEADESEDTISLLNRYIQESEVDLDKSVITEILQDVYREACEVE